MNKQIVYLYPEREGQQHWICWGLKQDGVDNRFQEQVRVVVLEALNEVKGMEHAQLSQRSFTVGMGEFKGYVWVAIPRQLSVKIINVFNERLATLQVPTKRVITSYQNPFGKELPFSGAIFYDRGFIVDSTSIDEMFNGSYELKWTDIRRVMN